MATKQAAPPPAPLSAPAPPAASRAALAPTVVEIPKDAPNPLKELNERQAASLAKIAEARRTAESGDREGPPPPPKATPPATSKSTTEKPSSEPSGSVATSKTGSPKTSPTPPEARSTDDSKAPTSGADGAAGSTPKELRYDEKSLSRWAEKNPEEAKAWVEKQFKKPIDDDWVKLSHKRRRLREDVREQSAAGIKAAEEKLEQALKEKAVVDDAVGKLSPVADLWDAVGERVRNNMAPDFEAGDAAFLANTGIPIDDYMRARARRGIINPEMAKQKAENARLKRELEATKGKVPAEPAKAAEPEEKPAPKALQHKVPNWAEDIEKKHGLRKFTGWEAELGAEMAKHHDEDLDEYSKDVEDVADKLLKKKLAELQGVEEPEEPKPKKAKRAPASAPQFDPKKVKAKGDEEEDDDEGDEELIKNVKGPTDPQKRMRWAMERAAARSRNPGLE